ncbi:glycosyltransferase [Magnetococcus sp. PR-3]|uniref:glycosyltransferase n=1 Tax=Magnetococcus sp. PR-3 TaxID=3120355 RepID=UPI002FCE0B53
MTQRICIVTPDTIGPVANGGIGTHCYYLARFLALQPEIDVTLLFTGPCTNPPAWKPLYDAIGVTLALLPPAPSHLDDQPDYLQQSYLTLAYLQQNHFDLIHFQEFRGAGFHTLQARRTQGLFETTQLVVTMHSNQEWIHQGGGQWRHDAPYHHAQLCWIERYCCQHADALISPSAYMFRWTQEQHWILAEPQQVLPLLMDRNTLTPMPTQIQTDHLIFFGRLESRKGLDLFCEALLALHQEKPELIQKVTFLGKLGRVGTLDARDYLNMTLAQTSLRWQMVTNLDSAAALQWLQHHRGVVVIPSMMDNYPYTVLECLTLGIPFIASHVGGVEEMADSRLLFPPHVEGLKAKILQLHILPWAQLNHPHDHQQAEARWRLYHHPVIKPKISSAVCVEEPETLSICVPHYNQPDYLPQLLASIDQLEGVNPQVIVVDDGSDDPRADAVFTQMAETYPWTFIRAPHRGPEQTRNHAAQLATGTYLIFMDADNIAMPHMARTMVDAIRHSGLDLLTCHLWCFEGAMPPEGSEACQQQRIPVGAAPELALFSNSFGDTNFICRRAVFQAVGGFPQFHGTGWEDLDILLRLHMAGYTVDVLPQPLFWYRVHDQSFSARSDLFRNQQRIVQAFAQNGPDYLRPLMNNLLLPAYYNTPNIQNVRIGHQVLTTLNRILPLGSRRRQTVMWLVRQQRQVIDLLRRIFTRSH